MGPRMYTNAQCPPRIVRSSKIQQQTRAAEQQPAAAACCFCCDRTCTAHAQKQGGKDSLTPGACSAGRRCERRARQERAARVRAAIAARPSPPVSALSHSRGSSGQMPPSTKKRGGEERAGNGRKEREEEDESGKNVGRLPNHDIVSVTTTSPMFAKPCSCLKTTK